MAGASLRGAETQMTGARPGRLVGGGRGGLPAGRRVRARAQRQLAGSHPLLCSPVVSVRH